MINVQTNYLIEVKDEDIDILGHMNYMQYSVYSEKAMIDWYNKAGMMMDDLHERKLGMVLVKCDIDYMKEAMAGDSLRIETKLSHLGTKSFSLLQEIYHSSNEKLTEFRKTFVMFDVAARKSIPVIEPIASMRAVVSE